eukprot:1044789-Alexandrium_andersonii.AAC.1
MAKLPPFADGRPRSTHLLPEQTHRPDTPAPNITRQRPIVISMHALLEHLIKGISHHLTPPVLAPKRSDPSQSNIHSGVQALGRPQHARKLGGPHAACLASACISNCRTKGGGDRLGHSGGRTPIKPRAHVLGLQHPHPSP